MPFEKFAKPAIICLDSGEWLPDYLRSWHRRDGFILKSSTEPRCTFDKVEMIFRGLFFLGKCWPYYST